MVDITKSHNVQILFSLGTLVKVPVSIGSLLFLHLKLVIAFLSLDGTSNKYLSIEFRTTWALYRPLSTFVHLSSRSDCCKQNFPPNLALSCQNFTWELTPDLWPWPWPWPGSRLGQGSIQEMAAHQWIYVSFGGWIFTVSENKSQLEKSKIFITYIYSETYLIYCTPHQIDRT